MSQTSASRASGDRDGRRSGPRTLYDKIWDDHVVDQRGDEALLYIDFHLVQEVSSPQAFAGLRLKGRRVRRPDLTLAVADHDVPTQRQAAGVAGVLDPDARRQLEALERNVEGERIPFFRMGDARNGIVHVVGPEQGRTQPGMTIVCGDSHTSTHGAFGALAFGIGTSEVEHVLATQCLPQRKSRNMRVRVDGRLGRGVVAKDLALAIIRAVGAGGGAGFVLEYAGSAVEGLSMEGRMTLCNLSIEAGARAGLVAPDAVTFDYLRGRPAAPRGEAWDQAMAYWRTLPSDEGAGFDREVVLDGSRIAPTVTWGSNPEQAIGVDEPVPTPAAFEDAGKRALAERALDYMALEPGRPVQGLPVDVVFIGSCTNGRIEDLRAAAEVARGRKVAEGLRALVVPGSGLVRAQAEAEGLDRVFRTAGFEWREPGCSMCIGMNGDRLEPGQRCASTSNRNFEGRQGRGGRTHLMSPAMAAAAAVTGRIVDVRTLV